MHSHPTTQALMGQRPRRTIIFSCAGAPFSAEVLQAVHRADAGSLAGVAAVVLSRPPITHRSGGNNAHRAFVPRSPSEIRLAFTYRRRRLVRSARRRVRRMLYALNLIPAGRWRYIEDFCDDLNIPIHHTRAPSSTATLGFLRDHEPDFVLMMTFHHILRPDVLAVPTEGVFNVHCSLLPEFRGPDPIGDALRAQVSTTGVSLYRVDTGIDTGEVIAQRSLEVGTGDRDTKRLRRRLACLAAVPVTRLLRDGPEAACTTQAPTTG